MVKTTLAIMLRQLSVLRTYERSFFGLDVTRSAGSLILGDCRSLGLERGPQR